MLRPLSVAFLAGFVSCAAALPAASQTLPDLFTPAPGASGAPLQRIGGTHTSYCRPIVDSSASAAQVATQNDTALNGLADSLPDMRLDDDMKPKQEKELRELRKAASDIRLRAQDGFRATARIRAYAQTLIDREKQGALIAYADAFDDALRSQDAAATDMARALVIAEGRRASFEADMQMAQAAQPGSTQELDAPGSYRVALTAVGKRIEEHETDVRRAEKTIAERSKAVHC